jgi:hypothetical protein
LGRSGGRRRGVPMSHRCFHTLLLSVLLFASPLAQTVREQ